MCPVQTVTYVSGRSTLKSRRLSSPSAFRLARNFVRVILALEPRACF